MFVGSKTARFAGCKAVGSAVARKTVGFVVGCTTARSVVGCTIGSTVVGSAIVGSPIVGSSTDHIADSYPSVVGSRYQRSGLSLGLSPSPGTQSKLCWLVRRGMGTLKQGFDPWRNSRISRVRIVVMK